MIENGMAVGAQAEYERQRFGTDPQPEPLVAGPLLHPMFAGILQRFLDAQTVIANATPKVPE